MSRYLTCFGVLFSMLLLSCTPKKLLVQEPAYLTKREVEERVTRQFSFADTTHFADVIIVDGLPFSKNDSIPVFEYTIYHFVKNGEQFYWESNWDILILLNNQQGKRRRVGFK